jgi:flagellar motor switch protein FliN/FliY
MRNEKTLETHEHQFDEVGLAQRPDEHLAIEDLKDVRLTITADLGVTHMMVRELLELKQGSIVPLSKIAGEPTDMFVNGVPLARGEVVVIADSIHVRIAEVVGVTEQDKEVADNEE